MPSESGHIQRKSCTWQVGKVCIRAKRPIRPNLSWFLSHKVTRSISILPPPRSGWDASPLQGYPQHSVHQQLLIHLGGERHCQSVGVIKRALCLDTEASAHLITRPAHLPKALLNNSEFLLLKNWSELTIKCTDYQTRKGQHVLNETKHL